MMSNIVSREGVIALRESIEPEYRRNWIVELIRGKRLIITTKTICNNLLFNLTNWILDDNIIEPYTQFKQNVIYIIDRTSEGQKVLDALYVTDNQLANTLLNDNELMKKVLLERLFRTDFLLRPAREGLIYLSILLALIPPGEIQEVFADNQTFSIYATAINEMKFRNALSREKLLKMQASMVSLSMNDESLKSMSKDLYIVLLIGLNYLALREADYWGVSRKVIAAMLRIYY